jgi:hypothetical protein
LGAFTNSSTRVTLHKGDTEFYEELANQLQPFGQLRFWG